MIYRNLLILLIKKMKGIIKSEHIIGYCGLGIAFLTSIILARLLSLDERGYLVTIIAIGSVIGVISEGGVSLFLVINSGRSILNCRGLWIKLLKQFLIAFSVLWTYKIVLWLFNINSYFEFIPLLSIACGLILSQWMISLSQAIGGVWYQIYSRLLTQILLLIILLMFSYYSNVNSKIYSIAFFLTNLLVFLIYYYKWIVPKNNNIIKRIYIKDLYKSFISSYTLLETVQIDRIIFSYIGPTKELAYYAIALSMSGFIRVFSSGVSYKYIENKINENSRNISIGMFSVKKFLNFELIVFALTILLCLMIPVIYGDSYREAIIPALILSISSYISLICRPFIEEAKFRSHWTLLIGIEIAGILPLIVLYSGIINLTAISLAILVTFGKICQIVILKRLLHLY